MKTEHELLQFFESDHLPPRLRGISAPFCKLAKDLANAPPKVFGVVAPIMIDDLMKKWEQQGEGYWATEEGCNGPGFWGGAMQPINVEATWTGTKLACARAVLGDGVIESSPGLLDRVLRYVLEAKDCAVRAVLMEGRAL